MTGGNSLVVSSYRLLPASGHYPRLIVIPLGTLPSFHYPSHLHRPKADPPGGVEVRG